MLMVVPRSSSAQFFVAGLNLLLVGVCAAGGVGAAVGAYFVLPHVRSRVDRFLDPAAGDTYQITKSMEAFGYGGLFGRGPGEGRSRTPCRTRMPTSSSPWRGRNSASSSACVILLLFAFIVVRGLLRLMAESDLFVVLAATGLLAQLRLAGLRQHGARPCT